MELSKEKPSMKQVEANTTAFLKTLENVESCLQKQITYLTQVSTGRLRARDSFKGVEMFIGLGKQLVYVEM